MKPLNELIDAVGISGDSDEMANAYYREHKDRSSQHYFRAGHRACFDLLAPALREALGAIQDALCISPTSPMESHVKEAEAKIREILEGRVGE